MDGLSAAASVIAVIQVSSQIFDLCRTYYINVKDARRDIERLRNEITALQDVLIGVADLADESNPSSLKTLSLISQEDGPVQQCRSELTALATRLEPREEKGRMRQFGMRSLKWPFNSKEVDKILDTIGRHKSSFSLALATDQTALSLSIAHGVTDITQKLKSQKIDEDRSSIIRWLSTTDPSSNHHAACQKCQPGSGKWLLERPEFKEWQSTRNSVIWLHGIPGSGKTILSSIVIEELRSKCETQPNNALAYFYFDFNTTAKQEVASCLASILVQLCMQTFVLPAHLKQSHDRCNHGKYWPPIHELKDLFSTVSGNMGEIFIVLDALDECPKTGDREQLLAAISEMLGRSNGNLHVLLTSRREPDIEEVLFPLLTSPSVSVRGSELDLDIKMFISWQLATDSRLRKWSKEVKTEIETVLTGRANGMFRWVVCQLDALKRCLKVRLIRETLINLPKTLDDTYSRVFSAIDEAYREDVKTALVWLAFSERPLQLSELAEATIIHPRSNPSFDPGERFPDPRDVLEILSSIVTVHTIAESSSIFDRLAINDQPSVSTFVTLAHYSVKEYLISDRIRNSGVHHFALSAIAADIHIAQSCLKYIIHCAQETDFPSYVKDFPLLEYAAKYWHTHVRLLPQEEEKGVTPLVLELLLADSKMPCWLQVNFPRDGAGRTYQYFAPYKGNKQHALLHVVVLGLFHVAEELLDQGSDPNVKDDYGETALHRVAKEGDEAMALLLLNHGATVDATNPLDQTPLHWAAWRQNEAMVDLLLKWGADINAVNMDGETALHYAASDNLKMLKYLLGKGAYHEVRSLRGETPLDYAITAAAGRESVDALLEASAHATRALGSVGML